MTAKGWGGSACHSVTQADKDTEDGLGGWRGGCEDGGSNAKPSGNAAVLFSLCSSILLEWVRSAVGQPVPHEGNSPRVPLDD